MQDSRASSLVARIGFWLGLLAGAFFIALSYFIEAPEGLQPTALRLVGVTVLVGVWWVTEALPLGATGKVLKSKLRDDFADYRAPSD